MVGPFGAESKFWGGEQWVVSLCSPGDRSALGLCSVKFGQ
jgi:hypothetical protein